MLSHKRIDFMECNAASSNAMRLYWMLCVFIWVILKFTHVLLVNIKVIAVGPVWICNRVQNFCTVNGLEFMSCLYWVRLQSTCNICYGIRRAEQLVSFRFNLCTFNKTERCIIGFEKLSFWKSLPTVVKSLILFFLHFSGTTKRMKRSKNSSGIIGSTSQ